MQATYILVVTHQIHLIWPRNYRKHPALSPQSLRCFSAITWYIQVLFLSHIIKTLDTNSYERP